MKLRENMTTEEIKKRKKAIMLRLAADQRSIIVDEGKEILVGDCDEIDDVYKHVIDMLPKDDCRFCLYNASFEAKELKRESLIFIFWNPNSAPSKNKMIYGISRETVKRKLTGIHFEIVANKLEDISDRRNIAEKLGGSAVISMEGKPL
ncbi:hypothetical protein NDU88_003593 [Pleurodeles waltl]|uniref:ADF-H domain-containing protein n=2 Tax=Pleurodeles waltl TaxID=8319 RepID=A0AAV7N0K6_PLEWA|nr:hypothetical protein NDU88_003593 [Pleurodeles waltl]